MLSILFRYLIRPFISIVLGHAALQVCHAFGWYPENELTRLVMEAPTVLQLDLVFWSLVVVGSLIFWALLELGAVFIHSRQKATALPARGKGTWIKDLQLLLKELRHLRTEAPKKDTGKTPDGEFIAVVTASGSHSVQFQIPSPEYDELVISLRGVTFEEEGASFRLRMGDKAGIVSGHADYSHRSNDDTDDQSTCIVLARSLSIGEENSLGGKIKFLNPNAAGGQKFVQFEVIGSRRGKLYENRGSGVCRVKEGAIAIIDLSPLPGSFISGEFSLYGSKK